MNWKKYLAMIAEIPPCTFSRYVWYNDVQAFPEICTFIIKENYKNASSFIFHDHHFIKSLTIITLDKLTSTEIYSILISKVQNKQNKPFFNIYFENLFND